MKLKPIGSNKTLLELENGTQVLFSYETPVAARIDKGGYWQFIKTNKFYSKTTSKHINSWYRDCDKVDQSVINNLVNEGK